MVYVKSVFDFFFVEFFFISYGRKLSNQTILHQMKIIHFLKIILFTRIGEKDRKITVIIYP